MNKLTHFDKSGSAIMVDVSEKSVTNRIATAVGTIQLHPNTYKKVISGTAKKGDVLGIARIAAIQGAKRVSDLIPLCHPLPITSVSIDFQLDNSQSTISVHSTVSTVGRTGVEMEALMSASIGLLTIYDMCKAIDRAMVIGEIYLLDKSGGRSGHFKHPKSRPLSKKTNVKDRSRDR